jgi:hypothetical protein
MASVLVWSEREYPSYRDCVQSAGLMALVYAGWIHFPLGRYSNPEREALERASPLHTPESATTMAALEDEIRRRYGLPLGTLHSNIESLEKLLTRNGSGLVMFGINGNLPVSDPWRRWDTQFTGMHAVFIRCSEKPGYSRVFDPEAPMEYPGDLVANTKILTWSQHAGDVRVIGTDELADRFIGFRLSVTPGTYTLYHVKRDAAHTLYDPKSVTFGTSGAPVWHGIPGHWETAKGELLGYYWVAGHSGPFTINRLTRLANGKTQSLAVNPAS